MIWLLDPNSKIIKFKQYFNSDIFKKDNHIYYISKLDNNNYANNIKVNIYQTDNIILYEYDNKTYCYEYTEEYFDDYILYTYKMIDKHKMPYLNDNYYYYIQLDKEIKYTKHDGILYLNSDNCNFYIKVSSS